MNAELDKLDVSNNQQPNSADAVNVNINLNVQELNVVLGALQELPHRAVDGLLKKIFTQAQSQISTNR